MKNIFAILILIASCQAFAAPTEIFIIRHAEKEKNSPDLSAAGYARANKLAQLFAPGSSVLRNGPLCAIYAAAPRGPGGSMRPIETVTPMAQAQHLQIHTEFTKDDVQNLAMQIQNSHDCDGRSILIAWVHDDIPAVANAFNVMDVPAEWPSDVYDAVWDITFAADPSPSITTFSQGF